jgi:hypothetical protein
MREDLKKYKKGVFQVCETDLFTNLQNCRSHIYLGSTLLQAFT